MMAAGLEAAGCGGPARSSVTAGLQPPRAHQDILEMHVAKDDGVLGHSWGRLEAGL